MPNTKYWNWTYPDDNEEPYYDKEVVFKQAQDMALYAMYNASMVIPPAGLTWNPGTFVLSWSGVFEIPLMSVGFLALVPFGPDQVNPQATLNDGDRLYVVVPVSSGANVNLTMYVVNGSVPTVPGLVTLGMRRGTAFYSNIARSI